MTDPTNGYLTVQEVAKALRLNRNTVYAAIENGQLPHLRIGRQIRIPRSALPDLTGPVGEREPCPPPQGSDFVGPMSDSETPTGGSQGKPV